MQNLSQKFAEFLCSTRFEDIPQEAVAAAKIIIADCVAAITGGMAEAEMQQLIRNSVSGADATTGLFGHRYRTDPQTAAFLNGTAGTVLEMDEGHQFAKGHPGMHIFPALFAAAENSTVSGERFLYAFILGYDVAARIGTACQLAPTMHPHGTWGGVGAAAALACLHQLDKEQTAEYLNIASSLTLATSRKTMLEGGTVRNVYAGMSNQMAHLGLRLYQSGFSGEKDGIRSVFAEVVSAGFDEGKAFDQLGQRFEVCRNYFKLHACCRYNHAALDALWLMMDSHPELAQTEYIKSVHVHSYNLAAELSDRTPRNVLASKFSLPFAIATTLYHKSSGVLSFTEQARTNNTIQELCAKVTVAEDPAMTARLPEKRPATVEVEMMSGKTFNAEVETNRGDWQDPYTPSQLRAKFLSLSTRCWPEYHAEEVYEMLMRFETCEVAEIANKIFRR